MKRIFLELVISAYFFGGTANGLAFLIFQPTTGDSPRPNLIPNITMALFLYILAN
jgi:hypothetical protein